MKTDTAEIIASATDYTVIDDGQFMFPVKSVDLAEWIAKHGDLDDNDRYNQFCRDTPFVGADLGSVGSNEVIALCNALIEAGATVEHLS